MMEVFERLGEREEFRFILFEEIEHEPLGHLGTDGGKGGEMADEVFEFFRVLHGRNLPLRRHNE